MVQPTHTDPQIKLRIPSGLKERVQAAAAANNRSMNSEIVARLEQSFSGSGSGVKEMTEDGVEFRITLSQGPERAVEMENVRELAKALKLAIKGE